MVNKRSPVCSSYLFRALAVAIVSSAPNLVERAQEIAAGDAVDLTCFEAASIERLQHFGKLSWRRRFLRIAFRKVVTKRVDEDPRRLGIALAQGQDAVDVGNILDTGKVGSDADVLATNQIGDVFHVFDEIIERWRL